jgi:hypothetical protein
MQHDEGLFSCNTSVCAADERCNWRNGLWTTRSAEGFDTGMHSTEQFNLKLKKAVQLAAQNVNVMLFELDV